MFYADSKPLGNFWHWREKYRIDSASILREVGVYRGKTVVKRRRELRGVQMKELNDRINDSFGLGRRVQRKSLHQIGA